VRASQSNNAQQHSTSGSPQAQYQSDRNPEFQQVPIWAGIWFGNQGSEVQILSPRPLVSRAGWPILLVSLWNFQTEGALPSAIFGGWAERTFAELVLLRLCIMRGHASRTGAVPRRRQLPLHHDELLSTPAISRNCTSARRLSPDLRASAQILWVPGARICGHA